MPAERFRIEPAPMPIPLAPLRGETFALADGREAVFSPLTIGQQQGPGAAALHNISRAIFNERLGAAVALDAFRQHMIDLVYLSMSRNYLVERDCKDATCERCIVCLTDGALIRPIVRHLCEVSGHLELLRAMAHPPPGSPSALPGHDGTSATIN